MSLATLTAAHVAAVGIVHYLLQDISPDLLLETLTDDRREPYNRALPSALPHGPGLKRCDGPKLPPQRTRWS